jgi:hypothetical protein
MGTMPLWAELQSGAYDLLNRVRNYTLIASTPKVHLRLVRVRSYRDAVVAEIRAANRTDFPISLSMVTAARWADPILTDAGGGRWEAPQTELWVHYLPHDRLPKLAGRPGEGLTFQAVISTADGPLGRTGGGTGQPGGRPLALNYRYMMRSSAYSHKVRPSRLLSVAVIGWGAVPIDWSDDPAPGWIGRCLVRVEPSAGALGVGGGGMAAVEWPVWPAGVPGR